MKKHEILLIDDDPIINFINKKVVEKQFKGCPITILENGLKAMNYIKKKPDVSYLIFLDINMPEMNGWEFLEVISKETQTYELQIHILTSSVDHSDKLKAEESDLVQSYLPKPLKTDVVEKIQPDWH